MACSNPHGGDSEGDVVHLGSIDGDIEESPTCDATLSCAQVITCLEGDLYPTSCGPANCDTPVGACFQEEEDAAEPPDGQYKEEGTVAWGGFESALFRKSHNDGQTLAFDFEVTADMLDYNDLAGVHFQVTADDEDLNYEMIVTARGIHEPGTWGFPVIGSDMSGASGANLIDELPVGQYRIFVTPFGPYDQVQKYVRIRAFAHAIAIN